MTSIRWIALACAAMFAISVGVRGEAVRQTKLKNGLTVLLRPVPSADSVAVMTLYSIGNDQDPLGKCGLAHLIEHLYVCCRAGDSQPRTVHQFMQSYPAGWNAYTGDDCTVYVTVVPRQRLGDELKDAAARMTRLSVTNEEIEREKGRLITEVGNMFGGKPELAAFNLARQQVRPGQKNSRRGGVPEQVNTITKEEIEQRLDHFYKPCNAVLVVAGGFDGEAVAAEIQTIFGEIPAGKSSPALRKLEKPELGKIVTKKIQPIFPGTLPQVCVACLAPMPTESGYMEFLIIATRLMQKMQMSGGQDGIYIHYAPLDDPSVLILRTAKKADETAEEALGRLRQRLDEACDASLNPFDVQMVKNGLGAFLGLIDLPETMWAQNPYGLAFSAGRTHQMNVESLQLRQSLDNATSETLRKSAERFFAPQNVAIVIVEQKGRSVQ